ncbi:hypothetical protein [Streptomyces sp. NPDC047985]|uniref:hypothetical protein n=1 Tax=unclassified Streptomyces TaxID=2593676 RepID=UPI0034274044
MSLLICGSGQPRSFLPGICRQRSLPPEGQWAIALRRTPVASGEGRELERRRPGQALLELPVGVLGRAGS